MKLEIYNKKKAVKHKNMWKLNTFLNNQWIKEEIKREIISKQMKMETQHIKTYGIQQKQF